MKEHKHAEVLRAIADGKEVEHKNLGTGTRNWMQVDYINPLSCPEFEWRIKPEPKLPIVVEDCIQLDGSYTEALFSVGHANIRFTFDPDTKLPIKVELI